MLITITHLLGVLRDGIEVVSEIVLLMVLITHIQLDIKLLDGVLVQILIIMKLINNQ